MATYRFNVSFDLTQPNPVSITPSNVQVPPDEISLITFTLSDSTDAKFTSTPVQWQDATGQPTDLPPWFVMHRHGDKHFALWDFNSTPDGTDHSFTVSVFHDGQTFSTPDPVIVNEPPSGVG